MLGFDGVEIGLAVAGFLLGLLWVLLAVGDQSEEGRRR